MLDYMAEFLEKDFQDPQMAKEAKELQAEIQEGIRKYGIVEDETFGKIYAYETDGLGNYNLMDDANVPSLLSMDYLGYEGKNPQVAENTRNLILSEANPFYYRGAKAEGIGSPHTPVEYIWHIALCMQGLTASTREEKKKMIDLAASTDGGKMLMHEGFCVKDDTQYTREWFAWANAMFSELVMDYCGYKIER